MALNLFPVTVSLQARLRKLSLDVDVKEDLTALVREGRHIAKDLSKVIKHNGTEIMTQKVLLMTAKSPCDVDIENMQSELQIASFLFNEISDTISKMQTHIHRSIEDCRSRKKCHKNQILLEKDCLKNVRYDIEHLEETIDKYEQDIDTLVKGAEELEDRTRELERAAEEKKKQGLFGTLAGLCTGVILAPFSGGASLVVAGITGIFAGIGFQNAEDCTRCARKLRQTATDKREEADKCREKQRKLNKKKKRAEREVTSLENITAELKEASRVLHDTTAYLQSAIDITNGCIKALQEVRNAFQEALLQGDSFKIIQSAFGRKPEKLSTMARKQMDMLKEKWTLLEHVMIGNNAIT